MLVVPWSGSVVSTLYVDGANPNCSDTGSGSATQPFCTIGKAGKVAVAGQTVLVSAGDYSENVSVNSSGTATAPIVFAAAPGEHVTVSGQSHGFTISNRTWITVKGFDVTQTTGDAIYVTNSSNITLTNNHVSYAGLPVSGKIAKGIRLSNVTNSLVLDNTIDHNTDFGIYLVSGTTGVTISGNTSSYNARGFERGAVGIEVYASNNNFIEFNICHHNEDSGIEFRSGASNNLVVNNVTYLNGDHGIDMNGSPGQRIVSNSVYKNVTAGINVEGNSTGATLANNISVDNGLNSSTTKSNIRVDSSAMAGTTLDYDVVFLHSPGVMITWGSTSYTSLAAFVSATGRESNGTQADPLWEAADAGDFHLVAGSPAIDSANSGVSGESDLDADGNPRFDDPGTPNTGVGPRAYDDRGAYESLMGGPTPTATPVPNPTIPPPPTLTPSPTITPAPLPTTTPTPLQTTTPTPLATTTPTTTPTATPTSTPTSTPTATAAPTDTPTPIGTVTPTVAPTDIPTPPPLTATPTKTPTANPTATPPPPSPTPTATPTATPTNTPTPLPTANVVADEVHYTLLSPTSVAFDWRGTGTDISYGITTSYTNTVTATTPDPLPFSSGGTFREAVLSGLDPNTTYQYSIGGGPNHTFTTAPTGAFRFDVIGDIGDSKAYPAVATTQAQIAADNPAFVLVVGDLTYAESHGLTAADRHFNDLMAWSQDAAYMPAWGNHEWENPEGDDLRNYKGRFALPNPQAAVGAPSLGCCGEDWSWFDAGGIRFISYPEPYTSGTWSDWQSKANAIMAAAQADPTIRFIVTFGHRPAYSTGNHSGSSTLASILGGFGAQYSKYVLNFNGHSHDYERFLPISNVVHITAAGGGATLEAPWESTDLRTAYRAMHLAHVRADVDANGIHIEAVCGPPSSDDDITCNPGDVIDSVTIGTGTPTPTPSPVPTATTTATPSSTQSPTPAATVTPTPIPTNTPTPTPAGPTSTPTQTPVGPQPTPPPGNLVGNPGFETNTAGWAGSSSVTTITRVAGGHSGGFSVKATNVTTGSSECNLNDSPNWVTTTAPGTYTGSLWVRADVAGATLKLRFREYQSSTFKASITSQMTLSTGWNLVTVSYAPLSPGSSTLDFNAYVSSSPPGTCFYADDAVITRQ